MTDYKPSDFIYYEMVLEGLESQDMVLEDELYLTLDNAEYLFNNADECFKSDYPADVLYDIKSEFRCTGEECNSLLKEWSRHFEIDYYVKEFTGVTENGETISKWIGWNYYSGGGKHAYPEAIDWIPDAEFVKVKSEEVVTVIKRTFERE